MKVKVVEKVGFTDKYTKEFHKYGKILENITDERYAEIKQWVEKVENKTIETPENSKKEEKDNKKRVD